MLDLGLDVLKTDFDNLDDDLEELLDMEHFSKVSWQVLTHVRPTFLLYLPTMVNLMPVLLKVQCHGLPCCTSRHLQCDDLSHTRLF